VSDGEIPRVLRVAAYAVCIDDEARILLCRLAPGASRNRDGWWTLPGGGIEHGEHPRDAVLRELTEETGLTGAVSGLLDVQSWTAAFGAFGEEPPADFHAVQVVYRAEIVGGTLRPEEGGSTDLCRWVARSEVASLPVVELVKAVLPLAFGDADRG
jgi:ADP-ribose pyrophosphatase YjhB (NUDIX family)